MDIPKLSDDRMKELLSQPKKAPPRHRSGEKFLKGPIPLSWLAAAASLPGKASQVAMGLWYRAGLTNDRNITVGRRLLDEFGVGRKAAYNSLQRLEKAGLISVVRHAGRCPRVTILDHHEEVRGSYGSSEEVAHGD